ncbi:hypothetical protein [Paenibacillus sp. MMS18-CY102]|uniref:hypothetical protein n=1 Tax=Paenibacillus sp. MMS18-CY102 TaxID=2682849 RepID=UPI0013661EBC|nr:hypothetical protein [Paenibacillus sp. MMS18-CY102]MWC30320.1 hypothetical protein [Paenibacillus sp. MMS18-CY102]
MNSRLPQEARRFKTGTSVLYDGIYTDGWGGELHLLRGEAFPRHPEMGATTWTYASALMRTRSRGSVRLTDSLY